jgi:hypothetical protein
VNAFFLILTREPQSAELDDIIRLVVILLFVLGPILKKVFESKAGEKFDSSARRPARSRPGPAVQRQEEVAWDDLLARLPEVPQEEAPVFMPPTEIERQTHSEPLVPTSALADVGHESQLKESGGMLSAGMRAVLQDSVSDYSSDGDLVEDFHHLEDDLDADVTENEIGGTWHPQPGDWRRAIIAQVVLGPALTLDREQGHTGPPLAIL